MLEFCSEVLGTLETRRVPFERDRPVPVSDEKTFEPRAKSGKVTPPAKVEVAVVEVAKKYGAPILVPDSMPPEKVEVAVEVPRKYAAESPLKLSARFRVAELPKETSPPP